MSLLEFATRHEADRYVEEGSHETKSETFWTFGGVLCPCHH